MEYKPLGRTGIEIPPIIFGTSSLGNLYADISDETKTEILKECISQVPRQVVFDSAGKYGAGLALEKLGEILNMLHATADDVVISNKLGWLRTPLRTSEPEFEKGVWINIRHDARQSISYDGILECWEQGNILLDPYTPDLISVHDPDEYLALAKNEKEHKLLFGHIIDAYKALNELKAKGKAKAIGVGAKNWKTIQLIAREVRLDWVMFANSMTIFRHPEELLNFMAELNREGISIINSAVFHAGFLTGGDFFDYVRIRPDSEENRKKFMWRESFYALCKKHNVIPAHACVQFGLTPPGVVSIALNTSNPGRVKDNVASVECEIPAGFWKDMLGNGLIDRKYQYLKI